jgi:hypothetical protein
MASNGEATFEASLYRIALIEMVLIVLVPIIVWGIRVYR